MDLLPCLGWPCVETVGTQQPHVQLLGCFSKRNVPISVVYGCQSSELCCGWWTSLRTDIRFDIAGILKWLDLKICYCLKCSQYRAWRWWTVMHVKQSLKCNVATTLNFVTVKTSAFCQSPALAIHRQVIASWPSPLLLFLVQKLQATGTLHFLVPECLSVCFSHKCIYSWEVCGLQ